MTSYELPKCLIIDAKDHILGRLASTVSKHLLLGTKIYILRCERIVMSGHFIRNKLKMRGFFGHRMNTNPRRGPFHYRQPSRVFFRVVRGMIPHKTNRGKKAMSLLHCYDGMPPRYMNIRKVRVITAYRHLRLDPNRPFTRLGRLMLDFGWRHSDLISRLEQRRKRRQKAVYKIKKKYSPIETTSRSKCCTKNERKLCFLDKI